MENKRNSTKNIIRVFLITAFVLMIPLVAMQFTDEVNWELNDFVVMGVLISGTGLTYELLASRVKNRAVLAAALGAIFLFIWAELAVGIIGTPFAGS